MSNYSTDNEIAGTTVLTGAAIAATFVMLLGVLSYTGPRTLAGADDAARQSAAGQPVQTVVVVAPRKSS